MDKIGHFLNNLSRRKRLSKDKSTDQVLPPYITVCLHSPKKNAFGSDSQFLRWSHDELNILELIKLPEQTLEQEWIASQALSIYNHISTIYNTVSTTSTNKPDYLDSRSETSPDILNSIISKSNEIISSSSVFPTKHGEDFGDEFFDSIQQLIKNCFTIMTHLYSKHLPQLIQFGNLHLYLNQLLLHLVLFGDEYRVLEAETRQPLDDLIGYLLPKGTNIKLSSVRYKIEDSPPAFVLPASGTGTSIPTESGDYNNNFLPDTPKRKPSIMDPSFYSADDDEGRQHSSKVQDNSDKSSDCTTSIKSSSFEEKRKSVSGSPTAMHLASTAL